MWPKLSATWLVSFISPDQVTDRFNFEASQPADAPTSTIGEKSATTEDKKIEVFVARMKQQWMLWDPSDHSCKKKNKRSDVLLSKSPSKDLSAHNKLIIIHPAVFILRAEVTEDILQAVDKAKLMKLYIYIYIYIINLNLKMA